MEEIKSKSIQITPTSGTAIVIHTFNQNEDEARIKKLLAMDSAYELIYDIDQTLRSTLKHGDADWLDNEEVQVYLDGIRDMIHETGLLEYYE